MPVVTAHAREVEVEVEAGGNQRARLAHLRHDNASQSNLEPTQALQGAGVLWVLEK